MARLHVAVERAVLLHGQSAAAIEAVSQGIDAWSSGGAPGHHHVRQHELAARLRAAAAQLAPGWLGASLDVAPPSTPLPQPGAPATTPPSGLAIASHVRLGLAQPLDDARFPVVVPIAANLAIDADARDPRVAGLLRSLVLRLVAGHRAGSLRIHAVDPSGVVFAAFAPLVAAGIMRLPAGDRDGLRSALADAEQWVSQPSDRHAMLLVISSLPELAEAADLARIAHLAQVGPPHGLRLVVAGWPPPPLSAQVDHPPLANATQIELRNPHAVVGDPPGSSFGASGQLNAPVYLDADPPPATVRQVCAQVSEFAAMTGSALADLLPQRPWTESSASGLAVEVGRTGGNPLALRLNDLTPHWLIGGRSGAGKTAFLTNVLYGMSTRYGPDQLSLYLLDFKEGVSFTEFTPTPRDPTWIPHARAVGVESDREYGLAVLRELEAEMSRRAQRYKDAGVTRFADLRSQGEAPRVVCVVDEFQVLVQGTDRLAREAVALLESLARKGRSYGIHLVLASQTMRGVESLYSKRDSIFGQFPVRVALPGGGDVLDPLNRAADPLDLGQAIINTAGGLGGPSGALRAHERLVEFPDPHADPGLLRELRHRLHGMRTDDEPPHVFHGYAPAEWPADFPPLDHPEAHLGRFIDVTLSPATFRLDATPGRHLAVLGPSELGADLLDGAARSLAAQITPGQVPFVVLSRVATVAGVPARLVDDLQSAGHPVDTEWSGGDGPAFLIGFGMDGSGLDLTSLLRDGPATGIHLLGWWRGLRRFTEDTGGSLAREEVAGLILLNIPAADAALLIGDPALDWQPRANRALFYDRHEGRADPIIPFARSAARSPAPVQAAGQLPSAWSVGEVEGRR